MSTSKPALVMGFRVAALSADRLGIWASALCMIHCLVTPVLLSLSSVFAHFLPSEEHAHRVLAITVTTFGALALFIGYRRHKRAVIFSLMASGLALIFFTAWLGHLLPAHWMEVMLTLCGSALMIKAHRLNHTFCSDCKCAAHAEPVKASGNQ